jgi:hypothetical protein
MNDNLLRLSTIEPSRDFSVLLLTFVTTSGCFSLSGGRTTTSSDPLVVCARVVGQGAQDGRIPSLLLLYLWLLELRDEKWEGRADGWAGEL